MHHTKKAQTPMDAETLPKLETMIITETLTKGSDEDAHNILEMLGLWLYSVLGSILIDPRGCESTVTAFLECYSKDKGAHIFTAAPATLQRHLNCLPISDADSCPPNPRTNNAYTV